LQITFRTALSQFVFRRLPLSTDRRIMYKFREIWPTGNQWNRALVT